MRIEELGYAIRQTRKTRKLTQLELASEAGLSRTTLLDEASPALRKGLIEDVARWSTPGKVEKNMAAMRKELGITRED